MQEDGPKVRDYPAPAEPGMPDIGWLAVVVAIVTIGSLIILASVHERHDFDGDAPVTSEYADCLISTIGDPDRDADACKPDMPWYAAHPIWYSLAIGGAVLIVGRLYIFMRRTELRR